MVRPVPSVPSRAERAEALRGQPIEGRERPRPAADLPCPPDQGITGR